MNKYEKLDWLNEKFQTKFGLINLTNKPDEKLGYYVLVRCEICKNHKNQQTVPLVIGNGGGPGQATFPWLMSGLGPYTTNINSKDFSINEDFSITKIADFFLPELPLGTGWSSTKSPTRSLEDNNNDFLLYLQKLEEIYPDINKQKPIYLLGGSYGAPLLASAARILIENGYNQQGYIADSPYADPYIFLKHYTDTLYKNGTIGYIKYQLLKIWGDFTHFGLEYGIYGSRSFAWFSELIPYIGLTGQVHCPTDARHGQAQADCLKEIDFYEDFFSDEKIREKFHGGTIQKGYFDFDAHDYLYLNDVRKIHLDLYQYQLSSDQKVILLDGQYDTSYNIEQDLIWLSKLHYSKKDFEKAEWVANEFGRYKKWGNLCQHEINNSGHITLQHQPKAAYTILKAFIQNSKIC